MRARGATWLHWADRAEDATPLPQAARPSPRPPATARPRRLSITEIKTLIRDPYAIYAKHVLGLRPLDPMMPKPDARERGIVLHEVFERFVTGVEDGSVPLEAGALSDCARTVLHAGVPWPTARILWQARLERIADWFTGCEADRRLSARPVAFEVKARLDLSDIGFVLTGQADRIDRDGAGQLLIYDYKSGSAPTGPQQKSFDKQLLIEAAIAEAGGFDGLDPAPVDRAVFIGLTAMKEVAAPLDVESPAETLANLRALLAASLQPNHGFTARRMMEQDRFGSDYDHLSRYGEWDETATPVPEDLT
jgi:RecB family exonuclease